MRLSPLSILPLLALTSCGSNAGPDTPMPLEDTASTVSPVVTGVANGTRLLIITSSAFAASPVLTTFVTHKRTTMGVPTGVMRVTDLLTLFPGHDAPESIKKAIENYNLGFGVQYVMLLGDAAQVPARYRIIKAHHPGAITINFAPSDLYYANLYQAHDPTGHSAHYLDTWDGNQDYEYNASWFDGNAVTENPDEVDGYPDVAVGRVPATTVAQMETYLSKVMTYETAGAQPTVDKYAYLVDYAYPDADQSSAAAGMPRPLLNFA